MICSNIYGINTTSDITKLLYIINSRAIRRVKFEAILKYHKWYLCQTSCTNRAIICFILLHEKFLQFDWLRAVVFQLNLKYLHVKITNLLQVVV